MSFDLATAKNRKGILPADTTQDALIVISLAAAKAVAETYCNRKFDYAAEIATFHFPNARTLQLSRYPIEQVTLVAVSESNSDFRGYQVINGTGQVVSTSVFSARQVEVQYAGGYRTLPADLELALWLVFDEVWSASTSGGVTASIKSVALADVGTVQFSDPNAGASAGFIKPAAAVILNLYRLEVC